MSDSVIIETKDLQQFIRSHIWLALKSHEDTLIFMLDLIKKYWDYQGVVSQELNISTIECCIKCLPDCEKIEWDRFLNWAKHKIRSNEIAMHA